MSDTLFKDIVGQTKSKRELDFYLTSYLRTKLVPHMMFVAPKGQGKTTLARAFARGLVQFDGDGQVIEVPSKADPTVMKPKKKTFIEVNCSTIRGIKAFVSGLLVPYVQDKDVTVLFDEASELPRDVTMALLTIINPNPENRTTFSQDEYVMDFDFRRQTFLFATSEIQKVFHALADRLERITLEEYTNSQLAAIVAKGLPEVTTTDDVLLDVATVLRGNARAAQKMAGKIMAYLKGETLFTPQDWENLKQALSISPLGLNDLEIQVLRHLALHPNGVSLTNISARTGMSRESLQKDVELYLQHHSLMEVQTTGRVITARGLDYLKQLPA